MAALDLFASVSRPVASGLRVNRAGLGGAAIEPEPPKQVFRGFPLLIFGECNAGSQGAISLAWETGGRPASMEVPVAVTDGAVGDTLKLLRGARLITDAESRPAAESGSGIERRAQRRYMQHLEQLSRTYGLASRAMSLVAVVERPADRPGLPPETRVIPVGLPQDMEFSGVFGQPAAARLPRAASMLDACALFRLKRLLVIAR